MPIALSEPLVIPPTEREEFDELYITKMVIEVTALPTEENPDTGHVSMELMPYNRALNKLGPESARLTLSSGKLFSHLESDPTGTVAQAFGAIVNAVPEWRAFVESQNTPAP